MRAPVVDRKRLHPIASAGEPINPILRRTQSLPSARGRLAPYVSHHALCPSFAQSSQDLPLNVGIGLPKLVCASLPVDFRHNRNVCFASPPQIASATDTGHLPAIFD